MFADTRELLQLAKIWLPYGGPPSEEIVVRFGLSRTAFNRRVLEVLRSPAVETLTHDEAAAIARMASGSLRTPPANGRP
ncbi:hypothetical protein [Nocardia aurea]|uniref:hypothetical protein n=1 Tax=Nocardia aurea TaxID=2144174 RepID=UPI000D688F96|nr:hypothetical protein [Nocardia aurea]